MIANRSLLICVELYLLTMPRECIIPNTIIEVQVPHPESPSHTTPKPDKGKGIARDIDESPPKLVKASTKVHPNTDTPTLIPFEINGKFKPGLIKVVHEEDTKASVDPKDLSSKKGGQEFLRIQDVEIKVLNREHSKNIQKAKELRKKRIDPYRWTTTSRCKPKTITEIHIYPNIKPVAITVFGGNDKRNFDVHKPFRFSDFGVTKWDELNDIIPKEKNKVVEDLMNSLRKKYERLRATPDELGIKPTLFVPGQGVRFINNLVIENLENEIFFIDVFGDEAFQRMSDIHKVDVKTLLTYLVMASNISTLANQRFCAALRSLIDSHPDKEKLKSKKVKLEAIGYSLN
ncbi:hypothetical protein Tco_1387138 [Tanacetum coccineum]